ncbi:MAG: short-chain dehydrogenase/reductase SDR [Hyphomonadaceae bacterium]|nr:MAG: short-chain dehydrogenase/reductase SDR [Hyphomonadaceae bacterium]KAF0186808.1 MAG: short-chain dehydrogenase/reductase SDR [Hyphomonadaceae bacterium]
MNKLDLKGRTMVITGAGSGIGRATAIGASLRGAHLALVDVNKAGLEATKQLCVGTGDISLHLADLSMRGAIKPLVEEILAKHPKIHVLINNAGVAVAGEFTITSENDFDWLMEINFHAVVRLTRAFLPILQAQDQAQLVNISSIFGVIAPVGQTAYCASKFAVRGFSESLRHELAGSNVGVTVVHPGGIATSIASNARLPQGAGIDAEAAIEKFNSKLVMPPKDAGEFILKAIENRAPRLLIGNDAKLAEIVQRIWPVTYWKKLQTYFS